MKIKIFVSTFLILILSGQAVFSSDIDLIKQRVYDYFAATGVDTTKRFVRQALQALNKDAQWFLVQQNDDGSWNDLDYSNADHRQRHYKRLAILSQTFQTKGQSLYHNQTIIKTVEKGLKKIAEYVYVGGEKSGWWDFNVGFSRALAPVLVLLEKELTPTIFFENIKILHYLLDVPNLTLNRLHGDLLRQSLHYLYYALLINDEGLMNDIKDAISNYEIAIYAFKEGFSEGLREDFSFHAHGEQLMTGMYGAHFGEYAARYQLFTQGTRFQLPNEDIQLLSHFLLDHVRHTIHGQYMDPSTRGRGFARPPSHMDGNTNWEHLYAFILMAELNTLEQKKFQSIAKKILEGYDFNFYRNPFGHVFMADLAEKIRQSKVIAEWTEGHYHFNYSDYTVHRTQDYLFSVKMFSDRVQCTESINNENAKGWHLTDGFTYLTINGGEYQKNNVPATLDWKRLPGITCENRNYTDFAGLRKRDQRFAETGFVGGITFQSYGLSAMQFKDNLSEISAKKSWFFFDDEIVCIGSDIDCNSDNSTETIITQWPLSNLDSELYVDDQLKSSKDGWQEVLSRATWAHCDQIGYYFYDQPNILGKRKIQSGSWKEINYKESDFIHQNPFLTLLYEHGAKVKDAKYIYTLLPNKTRLEKKLYAKSENISVIRHDKEVHAIYDQSSGVTGIVFWNAGEVGLIRAEKPCLLMYKSEGKFLFITTADPDWDRKRPEAIQTYKLFISGGYHTKNISTNIDIDKIGSNTVLTIYSKKGISNKLLLTADH